MPAPRLAPLPLAEWGDDARAALGAMVVVDGEPINIFATLARHPKMLKRWLVFAGHVLSKSSLPARDRELAILRTGWLCQSPYEWGQHVAIGKRSDVSDAEITALTVGPDDPIWSPFDAAVVRAADELHTVARIGDTTWATLAARYDEHQLLDLVAAIGNYHLVSFFLNTCGVPLDDGVDPSPMKVPD